MRGAGGLATGGMDVPVPICITSKYGRLLTRASVVGRAM
jgi:hypothetical protein